MLIEERADLNLQNLNGNTVRDIWNNMFPDTVRVPLVSTAPSAGS